MPRLLGLHSLFGAIAAIAVGSAVALLNVHPVIQLALVISAYILVSLQGARVIDRRRAVTAEDEEAPKDRFEYFGTKDMQEIQAAREATGRREEG